MRRLRRKYLRHAADTAQMLHQLSVAMSRCREHWQEKGSGGRCCFSAQEMCEEAQAMRGAMGALVERLEPPSFILYCKLAPMFSDASSLVVALAEQCLPRMYEQVSGRRWAGTHSARPVGDEVNPEDVEWLVTILRMLFILSRAGTRSNAELVGHCVAVVEP